MDRLSLKLIFAMSLLAAIVIISTSCKRNSEPTLRIGVSQCSADDWRTKMNQEMQREAMFVDGLQLEILSADDDNEKQIKDIEHFIEEGCDVIVMAPNEAEPLTQVVHKAMKKGIPVLLFDRNTSDSVYTAFRGADNEKIGRTAADQAINWKGHGLRVLEVAGLKGSSPAVSRYAGFHKRMKEEGMEERITTVAGKWNYDDALRVVDSILATDKDFNVIYAHNDRMAIGAREAARRHGLNDIKVIGIDAAPEIGIEAVKRGDIDATFFYPTDGANIIRTAIRMAEGKPVTRDSIYYSAAIVDSSNADILLRQNDLLKDESNKISYLHDEVNDYVDQHSAQTIVLYSVVAIVVLMALVIFLLLRTFWNARRHRYELQKRNRMLDEQNHALAQSRDELDAVYRQYQEATKSKLVFFTNVSHDLRTPLTLIADPVEQLAQASNLTPQQHTLMRLADKNVKILLRLINQILDFRKYENDKLTVNLSEVDMRQLAEEWGDSFRNAALKRHIDFKVQLPEEGDMHIALDREKFERVFFNLVGNSFKFTPTKGSVTVRIGMTPDLMTMTVADTGRGMTPEEAARVFERFYQIDAINPNGSGIGLSLAKAFVELMGGSISVSSEKGSGTEFIVEIPRRHVENADENTDHPEDIVELFTDVEGSDAIPADENARTILVIDDNPDIRTLLAELLGSRYTILQASNGAQGIRMALKHIPDLIICDVMMPDMDGMEVVRRLKEEVATSHIPVLMLTACTLDEQRIQGYECGADAYLPKPFNSKVLEARVDSLIANRNRIEAKSGAVCVPRTLTDDKTQKEQKEKLEAAVNAKKVSGLDIDNEFYHKFVAIVDKEMGNSDLSVEGIADEMGMSRVQFYRKLKALTGYSPAELIRLLRLKRADHLLRTTEDTVSEICYMVGFTSPSYFTKCYREQYGETPAAVQARTVKVK